MRFMREVQLLHGQLLKKKKKSTKAKYEGRGKMKNTRSFASKLVTLRQLVLHYKEDED